MNNNKEFSRENKNLEIIKEESKEVNKDASGPINYLKEGLKKPKNIFIGTLNVIVNPLKNRNEKHYKKSKFHLVSDIVLFFIIIILLGVWQYSSFYNLKPEVNLRVKFLSNEIVSGRVEIFEIEYETKNKDIIKNSNLTVKIPLGFKLLEVTPDKIFNKDTNTFNIGDLNNGANGKLRLKGMIVGDVGEQERLSYIFNYLENGKTESVASTYLYFIDKSALGVILDMPEERYLNSQFVTVVRVVNKENNILENIELDIKGENITIKSIEELKGEIEEKNNHVFIKQLGQGSSVEFVIKAVGMSEGLAKINIDTYLRVDNDKFLQAQESKNIKINKSQVSAEIISNIDAIKVNEELRYKIKAKNDNSDIIDNLNFVIASSDKDFEVSLTSIKGSGELIGNQINVGSLKPGQELVVDLSLLFKTKEKYLNKSVGLVVTESYDILGKEIGRTIYSSKKKVLSDFNVKAKVVYYSEHGDQLGSGPLPPQVDMMTNYWVFFEIENYGNDLLNFELTGNLTDSVVWHNNKTVLSGEVQFGEVNKKGVWSVSEILKTGGVNKIGFEIGLIPDDSHVGSVVDLVSGITYNVYDNFCKKEINGVVQNLNTNLLNDKIGRGSGVVEVMK